MRTGVYPGTFDPITYGHMDVIKRALKIFDRLIVAVVEKPPKIPLFSTEERIDMIKYATKDIGDRIEIESFGALLADYAKTKGTNFIVRGLRAVSDFDREFQMAIANKEMNKDIETIFVMTDKKYFYLNSSLVKEVARYGGKISEFVPEYVEKKLKEKYGV